MRTPRFDYFRCQRHILLDMHVPDWDEAFLAKFDPVRMADHYQAAGADAVMHYCNSHVGLNFWPSAVGAMHRGLQGCDIVGPTVTALHERGIASCAYYSSYFNNWAWTNHPDWRLVGIEGASLFGSRSKYGICCPCNRDYHAFQVAQVEELAATYEFDAFWFDMVFWTEVCFCDSCRSRYRAEADAEIPGVIDWSSPDWCRFAAARERWLAEAYADLMATVKEHADIPVFSNVTPLDRSWHRGVGLQMLSKQDLLGGDFGIAGDDVYVTSHMVAALTPRVMQYMNALTGYVGGASYLVPEEEQFTHHALYALLFGAQFVAIDAGEPDGTVSAGIYDGTLARLFAKMKPYENFIGGRPVADVAVYFSDDSRMSLDENGKAQGAGPLGQVPPHMRALRGAVRALAAQQIPAAIITRRDLADLGRYRVVVLPNVVRMSETELAAFRAYVADGGKLYASAQTSRLAPEGELRSDFGLADLFGCRYMGAERHAVSYVHPQDERLCAAIAPRVVVAHGNPFSPFLEMGPTSVCVETTGHAEVLATLDLPFGHGTGNRENQEWASIHASPPHYRTSQAQIVRNRHGKGEVVYSCLDIEANTPPRLAILGATDHGPWLLFAAIIEMLLEGAQLMFRLEADSGVMAVAFDDVAQSRRRLHIANIPSVPPSRPVPEIGIALAPPLGRRIVSLSLLPSGESLAFTTATDGVASTCLMGLEHFAIVCAQYV